MAIDVTTNPWRFDAADQKEGWANRNNASPSNLDVKPFIIRVKIDTGDGGDFLMTEEGTDSKIIIKADNTPPNDTLEWPIGTRVHGIYIDTLPANAEVRVWHGDPDGQ